MNSQRDPSIDFDATMEKLTNPRVLQYEAETRRTCHDVAQETYDALQVPLDFPPLDAAIVPGDRVAIALDPNVPSVEQVVEGAVRALKQAGAGEIDVVVSDEATDATLASLAATVGEGIQVTRHECSQRESLRYLGADEMADPIYLNRWLVDADFVLPITAGRHSESAWDTDVTGVFPAFADSAARQRHFLPSIDATVSAAQPSPEREEPAWLLGVQIMVMVLANDRGQARQVFAGTPQAMTKQRLASQHQPDDMPPSAPLVVASLDGDAQQQSWSNAARAVTAAARYTSPNGTIVLWSSIAKALQPSTADTSDDANHDAVSPSDVDGEPDQAFPRWNADEFPARRLEKIAEDFRLLIHAQLDQEAIESMGFGAIESVEELNHLSRSFESCGVLRAAQFAGRLDR